MTDSKMLEEYISESGYKIYFIAKKLGITYPCLMNKIHNNSEFKQSEIVALANLLNMDTVSRDKIFFAQNVDKISTN